MQRGGAATDQRSHPRADGEFCCAHLGDAWLGPLRSSCGRRVSSTRIARTATAGADRSALRWACKRRYRGAFFDFRRLLHQFDAKRLERLGRRTVRASAGERHAMVRLLAKILRGDVHSSPMPQLSLTTTMLAAGIGSQRIAFKSEARARAHTPQDDAALRLRCRLEANEADAETAYPRPLIRGWKPVSRKDHVLQRVRATIASPAAMARAPGWRPFPGPISPPAGCHRASRAPAAATGKRATAIPPFCTSRDQA